MEQLELREKVVKKMGGWITAGDEPSCGWYEYAQKLEDKLLKLFAKPNKKVGVHDIRILCEKNGVDIDIRIGKKTKITISNDEEIHSFMGGWDNLDYDAIKTIAQDMTVRSIEKIAEIKEQLKKMDASQLPDNLFEKKLKKD